MDRLTKLEQEAQELLDEARALLDTITTESRSAKPEEDTRFDEIEFHVSCLAAEHQNLERAKNLAEKAQRADDAPKPEAGEDRGAPAVILKTDPFDPEVRARIGEREAVMRALDTSKVAKNLPAENLEEVERKANLSGLPELRAFPQHVLAFGSDAYGSAFVKASNGKEWDFTPAERDAWSRGAAEARAMGLTDASGGYMIPTFLDPTVINTRDGSVNPYRRISTVVQVAGDNWNGVSSAGISIAWGTEFSVPADGAPAFGAPSITPYKAHGFVPISIEGYEDITGAGSLIAGMFMEAKDDDEAEKFATGTGSTQPVGIVTALVGTASQTTMATNNAFVASDLFKAQNALGAKYRSRASWTLNLEYQNRIRAFGSSDNYYAQTVRLPEGAFAELLGRPAYEASGQTGTLSTGTNNAIVFGDFSNYVIVDRIGMAVEFIPHLFDQATGRPNGSRGWYTHWRTGADSVNDTGFTLLVNPNTAWTG